MSRLSRSTHSVPALELRAADRVPIGKNGHGQVHDTAQAGCRAPTH